MIQTFTCCTFPQAKKHTREVRSLTLFSRLEILTSFTHLFAKFPRVPNCFELAAIFEINWREPRVSYLPMPLHLSHQ